MATQKTDKLSLVGTSIFGAFLVIQIVVAGIFIAAIAVVIYPIILLGDFIEKKIFKIKEIDLEDDPEWYRSGGRGTIF